MLTWWHWAPATPETLTPSSPAGWDNWAVWFSYGWKKYYFININLIVLLSVLLLHQRHLCGWNVHLLWTRWELPTGPCYKGHNSYRSPVLLHSVLTAETWINVMNPFMSTCVCLYRGCSVCVNTTPVERAVTSVVLVTTSSHGNQEPYPRETPVKVRDI